MEILSSIWILGVIAFLIYDHIIGFGIKDYNDSFESWGLAAFWFITIPVLIIRAIYNKYSKVAK